MKLLIQDFKSKRLQIEITHRREVFVRVVRLLEAKNYEYKGYLITSIDYTNLVKNSSSDIVTVIFEAEKT